MPPQRVARPEALVRAELARALLDGALLPARALAGLPGRAGREADLRRLLADASPVEAPPATGAVPARPLRIFVSCAEASGETHAVNLVRALRARLRRAGAPHPLVEGLGGVRLEAEAVTMHGRPVERAAMGLRGPLANLGYYRGLLLDCARSFREDPPDVCVPVDSPALHVPLARIARSSGVPVVHFITPQHWAWAPWRARAYGRAVDLALSILPFEPAWFARRGVRVAHVGHPLLDELSPVPPTRPGPGARELVLLPGSRRGVIERNLPWMLRAASRVRERLPGVDVVVAQHDPLLQPLLARIVDEEGLRGVAQVETGDLHATLGRARAALSVSGTVLLDLLHHRLPAVVVYRLGSRLGSLLRRGFLDTPWFASVNLLCGEEAYPEFCFAGEGPVGAADEALGRLLEDEAARERCIAALDRAAARLGPPGACDRAAAHVIAAAGAGSA